MVHLAAALRSHHILDRTGLTREYDFTLWYEADASAARVSTALEKQLGLKLEERKAASDVVVIDHAERAPTEN